MPNGVGKNWSRLLIAVNGFRIRYRRWPTQVRMWQVQIDDIKSVFKPDTYEKLISRIKLIADEEATVVAGDESGRQYDYGREGFPRKKRGVDAATWLGIEPDVPPWDMEMIFVKGRRE